MGDRDDLLRDLRLLARKTGLLLVIESKRGKGSHMGVRLGDKETIIPHKVPRQLRRIILKQLGIKE
ncbi:MAG: hypothetical protein ACRC7G_00405 [Beijerinckiaceae bacterium]